MKDNYSTQQYVAVIDYSLGNLSSINHALTNAEIQGCLTDDPIRIKNAAAVILPGVGAFNKAMEELNRRKLVNPLEDYAESGRPLIGICLGMQLLFTTSEEFGKHKGLNIIPGHVCRFPNAIPSKGTPNIQRVKVPQVGWNTITPAKGEGTSLWRGTFLENLPDKPFMYFMHSYYVTPNSQEVQLSITEYAGIRFCSSVAHRNIVGFQFHPERSGEHGLMIYRNLAKFIKNQK